MWSEEWGPCDREARSQMPPDHHSDAIPGSAGPALASQPAWEGQRVTNSGVRRATGACWLVSSSRQREVAEASQVTRDHTTPEPMGEGDRDGPGS